MRRLSRWLAAALGVLAFSSCTKDGLLSPDAMEMVDAPPAADGRTNTACETTAARTSPPEVFVGPSGWISRFKGYIDSAQTSIKLQMYLFNISEISDALIAAHRRGVTVQVMLDPDHEANPSTKRKLMSSNVAVKDAPAGFEFAHAKYLVIDDSIAIVFSGNFNYGAAREERNYGFVSRDSHDVADLNQIFRADWEQTVFDQTCTRLVVSPLNSRSRLLALIDGATRTLELELMYLSDNDIEAAVTRAGARGVAIRAILASPSEFSQNAAAIALIRRAGGEVKIADTFAMHAKLIVADGVAFIGSENMSFTSLSKNREVGALVFEPVGAKVVTDQFERDWQSEPVAP